MELPHLFFDKKAKLSNQLTHFFIVRNNEFVEFCWDVSVFVGKVWQDYSTHIPSSAVQVPAMYEVLKILPVEDVQPEFDSETHMLSGNFDVVVEDSRVVRTPIVIEKPIEEPA